MRRRRAPAIYAASHVDHDKRVAWFSISIHASGSVSIVMVFCLAAFPVAGAALYAFIEQLYLSVEE